MNTFFSTSKVFLFYKVFAFFYLSTLILKAGFLYFNFEYFNDLEARDILHAFFWGWFDLAVAAFFAFSFLVINYLLLNRLSRLVLVLLQVVLISMQLSDMLYFSDAHRHTSYEVTSFLATPFSLMSQGTNIFFDSGKTLPVIAIAAILFYLSFKLNVKIKRNKGKIGLVVLPVELFVILLSTVFFFRGGVADLPLNPSFAYAIGDSKKAMLSLNGTYSTVFSIISANNKLQQVTINHDEGNLAHLYPGDKLNLNIDNIKDYNLVFILLESWSQENQISPDGQVVTPFFQQLKAKSFSSDLMIAGGHRTSEGIYSIFCSSQNPLGKSVAKTQLESFDYECLPEILKRKGWDTRFFQGSHKNTSGVGSFAQAIGFEKSYGKEDFDDNKTQFGQNAWGYYDQDLYAFILDKVENSLKEPFLLGINTNTTHDISLPDGVEGAFTDGSSRSSKLNVLRFSDQALAAFFAKMSSITFEKPVIYAFVADHTAGFTSSNLSEYSIPFLIYSAGNEKMGTTFPAITSQRDIVPTVVGMLGANIPWFAGRDLLHIDPASAFADYYHNGNIGWLTGDYLTEIDLATNDYKCYLWRKDFLMQQSVSCPTNVDSRVNDALTFTRVQQDLLFSGKTQEFTEYKKP
ncbi:LTA synthase family protein [Marinomonas sp. CT5]|uniref:LTA synthase family protein n=1 Tax=Marinomonas sp. CT5 TaxID=2066133 RepID=UPI001BAE73A0|nr:LTA synthase family protein [Marinomonas sp. CT5]